MKIKPRRGLALLLSLILSVGLVSGTVLAYYDTGEDIRTGTFGDGMTWSYDNMSFYLGIGGSGAMPDWADGTESPWHGFYIDSISFGSGVTRIGAHAFDGCRRGNMDVYIYRNDSLESIGPYAFANSAMSYALFPKQVTIIEEGTYANSQVSVLNDDFEWTKISTVGDSAFADCSYLCEITFPETIQSIGAHAFQNCSKLRFLKFRGNAPDLDSTAFEGVTANAWYPAGDKTWTGKLKNYGGKLTWKPWGAQTIQASSRTKTLGSKPFSLGAKRTKGDGALTYRSSNPKVAVISKAGKVTLKGVGKTVITITAAKTYDFNKTEKRVTITVLPKRTAITSLKNIKGPSMKVTWKRNAAVTGYQLQYSRSKTFRKGVKTITIKTNKSTTRKISKLTKKKRYYVRIRTYRTVSKKTYRSLWSGTKSLIIK